MVGRVLCAATAAAVFVAGSAGGASRPPPTMTLARATVDRTAHTVDLRLRICFTPGPHALLAIDEQRTLRGAVVAARHWTPSGVEPQRIGAFACRANWRLNWLQEPQLRGPGTYAVHIRVRDAYGRWTPPVGLAVSAP